MKTRSVLNRLWLLIIILLCVGCQKESELSLIPGQTLVDITDHQIVFEEALSVNARSYNGLTFEQFVKNYYYSSYEAMQLSNHVIDVQKNETIDSKTTQNYKTAIIVDVNNYTVKDATIYVYVPGEINLLLSSDSNIEFELINNSTIKILDWHSENTIDIVFTSNEDQKKLPNLKGNYVLFDFQNINQMAYEERISIDLEANESQSVAKPLEDWMKDLNFTDYTQLQKAYDFKSVLTNEKVSNDLLKKYNHAYIISLGVIKTETYLRVPKEILFISSGTEFSTIDDKTILIKKGAVTIIYK